MKLFTSKAFWGLMLVALGAVLLFQSLGWFEATELFWFVFCGIGSLLFIIGMISNRQAWWYAIPGISLLAITVGLALSLFTSVPDTINGGILLGGIGISFIAVYLMKHLHWWALIPGGVFLTLAVVAVLEPSVTENIAGGIFFTGLGITFSLVALLPNPISRMLWAWIPAAILLVIGLVTLAGVGSMIDYLWPTAIVLIGVYFIWRSIRGK